MPTAPPPEDDVTALRDRLNQIVARVRNSEAAQPPRPAQDVRRETSVILDKLGEVRRQLETGEDLREPESEGDSRSHLLTIVLEAQSTMQALDANRELSVKIQRGIRSSDRRSA